jgi:hypothetical protein
MVRRICGCVLMLQAVMFLGLITATQHFHPPCGMQKHTGDNRIWLLQLLPDSSCVVSCCCAGVVVAAAGACIKGDVLMRIS